MAGIHYALFLRILLLSTSLLLVANSQATPDDEKQILLQIKNDWGDPPALSSWNQSNTTPHCKWTGIGCAGGYISEISLSNQTISDAIPTSLCNLRKLSSLNLSYNYIAGTFPTTLYNCSNLQYLDISQNFFVGTLPADIDRMPPRLTVLVLSANNFTGDIPPSIGRLPSVQELYLDYNLFNGSVPAELGSLSNLEVLYITNNPFAPSNIPPAFGNLTRLSFLWARQANLIGSIPESFAKLVTLEHLDLSMNSLSGSIPSGIWMLKKLKFLHLEDNNLSGEINGTIDASSLVEIDLSINQLSGTIPEQFGSLQNLTHLLLYFNRLIGGIPTSIARLPVLFDLRLFNNSLTGPLPPELGKHSPLLNIEVDDNNLSGELPEGLCTMGALESLVVSDNNMTGNIPTSLGNCPTLAYLQLSRNNFSGELPAGIWMASNLTSVLVHDNTISGAIPDRLPWNLKELDIQNNRFTGSIPSSGENLVVLMASNNLFTGNVSRLAGLPSLQIMNVGRNMITGEIPPEISSVRFLMELNLSSNQLTGRIPTSIGSMWSLISLDFSDNQLSGVIPVEIGNLHLSYLNLSSNRLSGEIPISLHNDWYEDSFQSNPGLCSANSLFNLRTCSYESNGSNGVSREVRDLFIVIGVLLFFIILTFVVCVTRDHWKRKDAAQLASWKLTSFQSLDFTAASIVHALTEENLIGSGGAGKVYRVTLGGRQGEVVAVKKIENARKNDLKLEKEFNSEVEILGLIRHIRIVKLLCCISSADSKLLVYEYMENGSLHNWLHGRLTARASETLDWPTRLGIAVDAARGLCYMHHDSSPPIIHRDMKSSNILLDAKFQAKIADFGLARILSKREEPDTTSAVAGSIGYMAPECAYSRKVSEKADVYSFGVVLLELTTGREANDGSDDHSGLAEWAWRHVHKGNKVFNALDREIGEPAYFDEMVAVFKLGLVCTSTLPSTRPSMKEVLQILLLQPQYAHNER